MRYINLHLTMTLTCDGQSLRQPSAFGLLISRARDAIIHNTAEIWLLSMFVKQTAGV